VTSAVKTEGNDMDVLLRLFLASRSTAVAQRESWRLDRTAQRSQNAVSPGAMEAVERVLNLLSILTLTAPLFALTLTAGCAPIPRTASETSFVATTSDATVATVPPEVAGEFWQREHSREIKFGRGGIVSIIESAGPLDEELTVGRRVAMTEFSVEFIDVKFENPFGHPTMINSSSAPTRPVQPGTDPRGARSQPTPISMADQIEISRILRELFERNLRENGLIIVPQTDVLASAGYAKLKPRQSVGSPWAQFLKPVTTDTGIVFRTHTVPAPGLGVATCGRAALASAESQIKRETNADVVMAVKLRVGSYHQKATLEQNSTIRWMAADRSIVLTAQKSLVSELAVTDASRFIPLAGRIEPTHQQEFVGQLATILPAFIGVAFPSLPAKMDHDDPFARLTSRTSPGPVGR
jgi:hypothetical protein